MCSHYITFFFFYLRLPFGHQITSEILQTTQDAVWKNHPLVIKPKPFRPWKEKIMDGKKAAFLAVRKHNMMWHNISF